MMLRWTRRRARQMRSRAVDSEPRAAGRAMAVMPAPSGRRRIYVYTPRELTLPRASSARHPPGQGALREEGPHGQHHQQVAQVEWCRERIQLVEDRAADDLDAMEQRRRPRDRAQRLRQVGEGEEGPAE